MVFIDATYFSKNRNIFYIILRFCCVIINLQVCCQTSIGFLETLYMNMIYELKSVTQDFICISILPKN